MSEQIVKDRIIQYKYLLPDYADYEKSDLPTVSEVLEAGKGDVLRARSQEGSLSMPDSDIEHLASDCLSEINRIEMAARNPDRWKISASDAKHTRLIVDFSGPGTYLLPFKEDRYVSKPWAALMDRKRADTAAILGIHLAGIVTGNDYSVFTKLRLLDGLDPSLNELRPDVQKSIYDANIHFLYLGTHQEAKAIHKAVQSPSSFIPPYMVDVIENFEDRPIDNTTDQVLALKEFFRNKTNIFQPNDRIDFVLGPQAVRVFRMCRQFEAIPQALVSQVFPEPTPEIGIHEYPLNEIRGAIFYTITGKSHINPSPYIIIGE